MHLPSQDQKGGKIAKVYSKPYHAEPSIHESINKSGSQILASRIYASSCTCTAIHQVGLRHTQKKIILTQVTGLRWDHVASITLRMKESPPLKFPGTQEILEITSHTNFPQRAPLPSSINFSSTFQPTQKNTSGWICCGSQCWVIYLRKVNQDKHVKWRDVYDTLYKSSGVLGSITSRSRARVR